jgi:hypothetical protein
MPVNSFGTVGHDRERGHLCKVMLLEKNLAALTVCR